MATGLDSMNCLSSCMTVFRKMLLKETQFPWCMFEVSSNYGFLSTWQGLLGGATYKPER